MNNILVTRSSMPSFEEYCEEIKDIWDSHWLTNMGVKHKELQKELENYLGIPHVALYTNGHLALENAIAALNLPKGGEVITTPFTFASTTHAIVRNGLVPVFCDIKEDDYTIDTQKLENLITDNTVAIVPVHVYGNMCDVEEIDRIAKKYGLKVIYDAAHAFAANMLREEGMDLKESILHGSLDRLDPILMTALSSALALIPLAFRGDLPGNEIQSPMAKVILGGLLTSTFLNAFIIPIVYELMNRKKK